MIRSAKVNVNTNTQQSEVLSETLRVYRNYVRDLMVVINARWRHFQHAKGNEMIVAVETLIHPTSKRPIVKQPHFVKHYYKFPSYLRRVAIMDAAGQVRSFHSRYDTWLDGTMVDRPPKLTCQTSTFPSLYKGQCIKFSKDSKTAFIKVFHQKDWIWQSFHLESTSRYFGRGKDMSPLLVCKKGKWSLGIPTKMNVVMKEYSRHSGFVLAVDMGINTAATCAVVDKFGTVVHREFLDRTDKDQTYQIMQRIRSKARKATRHGNKLNKGFCQRSHQKLKRINDNQSHQMSRDIVNLAARFDCDAIILENLKYWRPKGGKKRTTMKMKFHTWFKSALAERIASKSVELGIKTVYVYARGTSSYAYTGEGKVKRDKDNYANATFTSGKRYNADLNAAYNIAARGIVQLYYPQLYKSLWSQGKPNACPTTGNPLVLSSIWLLNQSKAG